VAVDTVESCTPDDGCIWHPKQARPHWEQTTVTILWFVPVAVDTVENSTPDDGCIWRPKHVE
jgi:hypothetical protein